MLSASKTAAPSGGYNLTNSLRIRSSASAYLERTPSTTSGNQIFTVSFWVKRGSLGVNTGEGQNIFYAFEDGNNADAIGFDASDRFHIPFFDGGAYNIFLATTQVFRDPSAWYHIVVAIDTTQATASNRAKIYVNGNQITSFSTATYPSQNATFAFNKNVLHVLGAGYYFSFGSYSDLYLTEINWITGQALTPSSFGSTDATTGQWLPAKYTGTYGTNGFYLKFSDIATTSGSNAGLGKDFSGNANYWNTNNISVTAGVTYDAMIDSPTLTSATVANYCTLNPVFGSTNVTLSEANLKAQVGSTGGVYRTAAATFGVSSGKWYWELVFGNPTTGNPLAGVGDMTVATSTWNADTSTNANFWYVDASNGNKINGTGGPGSAYGSSFSTTDICMVALDMDNGKIWWGKNGTWFASGDPAAGTNAAYTNLANKLLTIALMGGCGSCGFSGNLYQLNFGQRPLSYTPPTGFVRLNTFNLPSSTIVKGNTVMDATLWTGDGATTRSITNASSFKPDLIWIKGRSNTGSNLLQDSNRGFGTATKLSSNSTNAENNSSGDATDPIYGYITAANSNGFSVNVGTVPAQTNNNGVTFVGWQWQAGQGSTSSNTSGSITSTVSVNATAGFSIVTYTSNNTAGATVGHGLGIRPSMIILKRRSSTSDWDTYHISLGATKGISLNTTGSATTSINYWNNTEPTSTVFTLGAGVNPASTPMLAYCWAEIAGFSKFGSFTANNSSNGNFIYLGFRPRWIMTKQTSGSGGAWFILDTARNTFNVMNNILDANTSGAERNDNIWDATANGMKLRIALSGDFIYAAFAENPFKNALAR